jgi:hypothetical protein
MSSDSSTVTAVVTEPADTVPGESSLQARIDAYLKPFVWDDKRTARFNAFLENFLEPQEFPRNRLSDIVGPVGSGRFADHPPYTLAIEKDLAKSGNSAPKAKTSEVETPEAAISGAAAPETDEAATPAEQTPALAETF